MLRLASKIRENKIVSILMKKVLHKERRGNGRCQLRWYSSWKVYGGFFEDLFFGLRGFGTYLIVHEGKTPSP